MRKCEISVEGLRVLRQQTMERLQEGRVPKAEEQRVSTAVREADERLVKAQETGAE